jgi:hypothetical protein
MRPTNRKESLIVDLLETYEAYRKHFEEDNGKHETKSIKFKGIIYDVLEIDYDVVREIINYIYGVYMTFYFISNENDEQLSTPTTSYKVAKSLLRYYQSLENDTHIYKIDSYLDGNKSKPNNTLIDITSKKPSKCIECPYCNIEYSKLEPHQGEARCLLSPTARTKGKVITWAMDTCEYIGGPITPGVDRVKDNLKHRQRHAPKWCPLYKEDK